MGFISNLAKGLKRFGSRLQKEKQFAKMFYIAVAVVVVLIVVLVCVSCKKETPEDKEEVKQETQTQNGDATDETAPVADYTVPDVALEENAYVEVNELAAKYFNAMTNGDSATITALRDSVEQEELLKIEKESAYIDEFDSLKIYTKPGPVTGSYVAFVYYEIKFSNIDTLAPGLTTLYICPGEDGSLYICDGDMTEQDREYVKAIVAQTDVADLFARVETKYAEAVDSDAALNTFMSELSAKLDEEVSQAMAQLQPETEEEPAETPEEPAQEATQTQQELVKATDTVNVRASDSENADRIGRIAMGETITRYEKKENGWSRVDYNGTEGYIKSEYLESAETASASQQTENETQEEPQDNASVTDITANGKVTVKETVNVRKSASTSGDKLGVAYQGETYELIMEQADGWCKIKFNGQTGYVKTEFVE